MRFLWLAPSLFLIVAWTSPSPDVRSKPPAASKPAISAPGRSAPAPMTSKLAPSSIPHPVAMFLANWSQEGKRNVAFKAMAMGTRFFIEDPSGVTDYRFDGGGYLSEAFLSKANLASARKKYPAK
ncbi:MAG: hypothetical protein ABIP63_10555 [Thermoanaerobaculia bacterium]